MKKNIYVAPQSVIVNLGVEEMLAMSGNADGQAITFGGANTVNGVSADVRSWQGAMDQEAW